MSTEIEKIDSLKAVQKNLPDQKVDFAASLIAQFQKKGQLSPKQWYWVEKLAADFTTEAQVANKRQNEARKVDIGDLSGINALFAKAQGKLKFPAVVLNVSTDFDIRLHISGQGSSAPGSISIKRYDGNDHWLGRIHTDGRWEPPYKNPIGGDMQTALTILLRHFAQDPAAVAAAHGKLVGRCCFCNTALSDPKSVSVGYGKTCAANYQLPWGVKAAAKEAMA